MKITIKDAHVLLQNKQGDYHLSIDEFNTMGEKAAKELAKKEIKKKSAAVYSNKEIDFNQAREMGFCEYGIRDFCGKLNLDIDKKYSIKALNKMLTLEALKEYPSECKKLFGKNTLKYLGGVKGVLSEDTISLVLDPLFIPERTLHELSVKFAYSCLDNFEKKYPDDKRPRQAIEAKEQWIKANYDK